MRRNIAARLRVLANDRDPDGDALTVTIVGADPPGLDVGVEGEQLASSPAPVPPTWCRSSTRSTTGAAASHARAVLVQVARRRPNRPPLANPDTATVVTAPRPPSTCSPTTSTPTATRSSSWPPAYRTSAGGSWCAAIRGALLPPAGPVPERPVRFTYTVSDGVGHDVEGAAAVRVLAEAPRLPPWARGDSAATYVEAQAVDIDVLHNDGDPSGRRSAGAGGRTVVPGPARTRAAGRARPVLAASAGRTGVVRCPYTVVNTPRPAATADIVVTVQEPPVVNEPPVVADEALTLETGRGVRSTCSPTTSTRRAAGGPVISSTAPAIGQRHARGSTITFDAPDAPASRRSPTTSPTPTVPSPSVASRSGSSNRRW